ncbi:MAG: DUF2784 family protein [bacterium]|nr:DUF2784 family protein [bacterium]
MYVFLNIGFFIFHSTLIVFTLLGWIWKKTRRIHLFVLLLTAFSWFILGIWYGFGYCPFTDWHYNVRMKLGHYDMLESYIKFLIQSLTGVDVDQRLVDIFAVFVLVLALGASALLNIKDWRKSRKASKTS